MLRSTTIIVLLTLSGVFHGVQSMTCICTDALHFAPVCASDGLTYANSKVVLCMNVCFQKNLMIVANQPCNITPTPNPNINQSINPQNNCNHCWTLTGTSPVCGTDGVSYPSLESLKCISGCQTQNLHVLVTGICPTSICSCSYLGGSFPVCGSDGKSYRNIDVLTCLNTCQGTYTQILSTSACSSHYWLNQQSLHFPTK